MKLSLSVLIFLPQCFKISPSVFSFFAPFGGVFHLDGGVENVKKNEKNIQQAAICRSHWGADKLQFMFEVYSRVNFLFHLYVAG